MKKTGLILSILLAAFLMLLSVPSGAQTRRPTRRVAASPAYGMRIEKKVVAPDSLALARRDSIHRADSVHRQDSVAMLGKSSLTVPAFTTATDSIVEDFSNGQRKVYYYGDVSVKYDDMELTAEYMEYDMKTGIVFAKGIYDSLDEEWKGRPVMKQGETEYEMDEVRYNFNTHKARITNMKTTEEDAILRGRNIKMMDDQSINMTKGIYTVCDAPDPHFQLNLSAAKVIRQPSQKTVFGPASLEVEGVKMPFVGIPFGFIPQRPKRATGILMPSFGEEEARGFYMRDLGMYFVFGDFLDLSVTGDYFTLGSWALDINSRYKVNYKFNGSLALNYSYDQTGERGTSEFFSTTNFGLKWSHTQDSKAHPGTTFSASVNFQSPSNSKYNSRSVSEALQNQISSSVSWAHSWNGKASLSINALHSQNSRDSSYTFTLPNVSFSISTFYPFKQKNRVGKEKFYEKISFGYNTSLQNKVSFKASEFSDPSVNLLDRFQNGMSHNFSIGLPNFQLLKYISITPGVSYSQNWFFRKQEYEYNAETNEIEALPSSQFNTLGITQNYSMNLSASTRLYGMYNFGKGGKLQALRHVISPSVSMNLSPEKGTYANGYRTINYTDASGSDQIYQYNIYSGQIFSAPGRGRSASMALSVGNNLEAKVRDYADTTGTGTKKVKLIDQLNFNTSYNFLADSLKMSVVSMAMSTTLFDKVSISGSASFDPYAVDSQGRKYNKFAITQGQGLVRLNSVSLSASYSISGKGEIKGNDGKGGVNTNGSDGSGGNTSASYYKRIYYHPETGEFIPGGWLYYTNPNVPWSLNFSASFSLTSSYKYDSVSASLQRTNNITATLNTSGNIKLTPKMSINATSGFDFKAMKMTTTQLSATYDLHCFNIAVSWVPMGQWKSYSFRIAANASTLADLLRFKKSDSYWDN